MASKAEKERWLRKAAKEGNLADVQSYLKMGVDVNCTDKNGRTPLHEAAWFRHLEIVRFLLAKGAAIDTKDIFGRTPLHLAAPSGHLEIVRFLLEKGAAIDVEAKYGETPLHWAAFSGQLEIVRFLLAKGAAIDVKNKKGKTPLVLAEEKGRGNVVQHLRHLNKAQGPGRLQIASVLGLASVLGYVPYLFEADPNEPSSSEAAAHAEARRPSQQPRHEDPLRAAAKQKKTKQKDKEQARRHAAKEGKLNGVHSHHKSDIESTNADGWTSLHWAACDGQLDVVRLLLQKGDNSDAKDETTGWTPLHFAAAEGQLEIVSLLLENGATIDATNNHGRTPLHEAASEGRLEIVRRLLEKGADIEAIDKDRNTPLFLASRNNEVEVVRVLLAGGANLDAKNQDNATPLLWAQKEGIAQVEELLHITELVESLRKKRIVVASNLLKEGNIDVNYRDAVGTPLLHLVVATQDLKLLTTMLAKPHLKIDATDSNGRTALANTSGYAAATLALLQAGASVDLVGKNAVLPQMDILEAALRHAASTNDKKTVAALLDHGVRPASTNEDGKAALHLAVEGGHVEVVAQLLEPLAPTLDTSLQVAARLGNTGHLETLLNAFLSKHTPEALAPMLASAFFDAKMHEHNDVVQMLQPHVAASRLHLASLSDDPATVTCLAALTDDTCRPEPLCAVVYDMNVTLLLATVLVLFLTAAARQWYMIYKNQKALPPPSEAPTPTHSATEAAITDAVDRRWTTIKALLSDGAPVPANDDTLTVLWGHVIATNDVDLLQCVLTSLQAIGGSIASTTCQKAFLAAVQSNKLRLVQVFLEDATASALIQVAPETGPSPLHQAAEQGYAGIVSVLVASQSGLINAVNEQGYTPLTIAAHQGHCDVIQVLLAARANVSTRLPDGTSMLHIAAKRPDALELLRAILMVDGLDINETDDMGYTALALAVQNGQVEAASLLVRFGANVSIPLPAGSSVLHVAATLQKEASTMLEVLLQAPGLAINQLDHEEYTALACAVMAGQSAAVRLLLEHGADAWIPLPNEQTVLAAAVKDNHRDIAHLLYTRMYPSPPALKSTDDLVLGELLKTQGHIHLYNATYRGKAVVLKGPALPMSSTTNTIRDEVEEMRGCVSPYVQPLIAILNNDSKDPLFTVGQRKILFSPTIVMEYMDGGDLHETLLKKKHPNLGVPFAISTIEVALVLAHALADLHRLGKVHRDVKSHNIFLSTTYYIRLGDLGSARTLDDCMTMGVGTMLWIAPEVLRSKNGGPSYGPPADIYSFGVVLTELDTGETPYANVANPNSIPDQVRIGAIRPTMSANCEPWLQALADQCLEHDPTKRPTADSIIATLVAHRDGKSVPATKGVRPVMTGLATIDKEDTEAQEAP